MQENLDQGHGHSLVPLMHHDLSAVLSVRPGSCRSSGGSQVLSCKSPAVCLHTPLMEKGPGGPFYQLQQVLAKGRHLSTSNLTESTVSDLGSLILIQMHPS